MTDPVERFHWKAGDIVIKLPSQQRMGRFTAEEWRHEHSEER